MYVKPITGQGYIARQVDDIVAVAARAVVMGLGVVVGVYDRFRQAALIIVGDVRGCAIDRDGRGGGGYCG